MPPAVLELLRPGLLAGETVALAGGAPHVAAACAALGAAAPAIDADLLDEEAVAKAVAGLGAVGTLVCDTAAAFAAAGGGLAGLHAGADGAWNAARAVTNAAFRPAGSGKIALVAPPQRAGAHAGALRAALENTARTVSVEWARYGIRTTAVLPGDATSDDEIAQLAAFLASPAGDYFSGCAFTLGAVG
jgi:NAD(P)-dependent dehydrogenase (short-subunit alcohol dehydrogenase family)